MTHADSWWRSSAFGSHPGDRWRVLNNCADGFGARRDGMTTEEETSRRRQYVNYRIYLATLLEQRSRARVVSALRRRGAVCECTSATHRTLNANRQLFMSDPVTYYFLPLSLAVRPFFRRARALIHRTCTRVIGTKKLKSFETRVK